MPMLRVCSRGVDRLVEFFDEWRMAGRLAVYIKSFDDWRYFSNGNKANVATPSMERASQLFIDLSEDMSDCTGVEVATRAALSNSAVGQQWQAHQ